MKDTKFFNGHSVGSVLLLSVIYGTLLLFYVRFHMHAAPLPGDEEHKITQAANFYHAPLGGKMAILDAAPYPPLVYFAALPLFAAFGSGKVQAVAVNILMLPIFLASIFYLCRRLGLAHRYGLTAAVLALFFPGVFALSRVFYQDFANIVMATASMAVLAGSQGFSRRRTTILFGIVAALGMLTRGSNPIFWVAPAAWVFFTALLLGWQWGLPEAAPGPERRSVLVNVIIGMVVGLAIASLWYFRNYPAVIQFGFFRITENANMADVPWQARQSLLFYLYSLIDYQVSPFLFFPVAAASLYGMIRNPRKAAPLVLWILVPYLFFIFPHWKLARYIAPILPAFAVLFALGVASIKSRIIRQAVIGVTLMLGATQFALFSLPGKDLSEKKLLGNGVLASTLLGFSMSPNLYQDDEPKPILDWDFRVREVGESLVGIQQKKPESPLDIYCFGEIKRIPGAPAIVVFPFPIGYILAVNHLTATFTWGALEPNGEFFVEEATAGLPEERRPEQCNVILSFGKDPIEKLGLSTSFTLRGEFQVQGHQEMLGVWERNRGPG